MITVTLHCDFEGCTTTAPADYVSSIDTYTYPDSPLDGITFSEPANWFYSAWGYAQPKDLAVLCPEHNTKEFRDKAMGG